MELEEIIKEADRQGLKAHRIASGTGLSANGVFKILKGDTKRPSPATLKVISDYLKNSKKYGRVYGENQWVREKKMEGYKSGAPFYDVEFTDIKGGLDELQSSFNINIPSIQSVEFWVRHGSRYVGMAEVNSWRRFLLMGKVYGVLMEDMNILGRLELGDADHYSIIPVDNGGDADRIPKDLIEKVYMVRAEIRSM